MIWDDTKIIAFDCEVSGKLPEYGLQPWRIKTGDAWITSGSAIKLDPVAGLVPHLSQLFPTRDQLAGLLGDAIRNEWTILGWNIAYDIALLLALGLTDLVMKVRWLDGMLLERHYDIEPEYEFQSARHKKKSYALKGRDGKPGAVDRWIPTFAGLDEDVDFHSTDPDSLVKLQRYNDRDNVRAWTIAKQIWAKLAPVQIKAALIEAECLPMVAQANLEGLVVDQLTARHLGAKLDLDAAARLEELAPEGVTEKIVRSPKQLGELLFDQWKLPVLKTNKSKVEGKEDSRSTDKEVLHELAFVDDRVRKVKQYREALNAKGKFSTSVNESIAYNGDGRTHPIANVFATYCVPGDVEVLTRDGWVALQDWSGGEIAQVHTDQRVEFLPATRFTGPLVDMWCRVDHQRLRCDFTAGHTMPYIQAKTEAWRTVKAGEMRRSKAYDLPVAGHILLSGAITPAQMRVLVAVQADGCFRAGGAVALTFEKPRKQERIRELLAACEVPYNVHVSATQPGRETIYIRGADRPGWLAPDRKEFGPWVLDTTPSGLEALVDEVRYWDGSGHQDGGHRYVSKERKNVEWVVTAAALVGRKAALHEPNIDGMSSCHISEQRAVVTVRPERHMLAVGGARRSFCATTRTGFWLARSKGHIFVTGNTGRMTVSSKQGRGKDERPIGFALHQMKREAEFREIITVPEGYDLVEFDAAGQEFRWMAVASGDSTMLNLCFDGEDAHSFMGAQIVGMDYRELVARVKAKEKTAGQNRYLGKFANLSLQYRTSARKLRVRARIDYDIPMELPEAQRIHATYQRSYPGVPVYWEQQIARVRSCGYVETFGGRRVQVKGNWDGGWGWSMGSTAINTRIQGTGADQKYLAMMIIKSYLNEVQGKFLFDFHDGLYLAIPTAIRAKAVVEMKRMLDNLPYQQAWGFTPPIPMPWDAKTGKAWGRLEEVKFA